MRGVVLLQFGQFDHINVFDHVVVPKLVKRRALLIKVVAASLSGLDVKSMRGEFWMMSKVPMIPGCDFAGIVVGIGQACSGRFKEGDFVFGATRFVGGAMAEYVVCLEEWVAPLPNGVPFHIAAALPTAMLAAYQGLAQANVKAGERVLVLGGSGGIGHFAVQIAVHLGAVVSATCSGANADFVRSLGAHNVIDYQTQQWWAPIGETQAAAQPSSLQHIYDVIFDTVGADRTYEMASQVLSHGGRLLTVSVGTPELSSSRVAALSGAFLKHKLWSLVSGPAYYFINVQISDEDLLACCQLVQQGVVVPHLGRVLQFTQSDVQQAISTLASGRARGKLVVQIAPETTTGVDALSEYARLVSTVTSCTDPAGCACEQPSESLVAAQPPVLPADDQP
ncbi:zinc-binding dehydrogenase [Capsaspora owczarzaki ATCC 30864]|uniref:Zinc-binding dehydrogenase n=1 Tax=Capsaspora owczarzaki (strain ATCC 30864) TaxID=595528 RepID=A0A0D2U6Q8_CAPO3|nr:zinc-binding dehydrogenase [Capsaspora owczarzaki ATCC 30864]